MNSKETHLQAHTGFSDPEQLGRCSLQVLLQHDNQSIPIPPKNLQTLQLFTCTEGSIGCTCQVTLPNTQKKPSAEGMSLVEVGPRCCFNPIKMFAGSFGGPVLYDNPAYVSPNRVWPMLPGTMPIIAAGCVHGFFSLLVKAVLVIVEL